jgi:N-acetyl-anhydromuramyl-L-alanine amidase AmpD
MKFWQRYPICFCLIWTSLCFGLVGCDAVYRLLQREGAEEKELLGEVVPFEYNAKVAEVQKILKLFGYRIGRADGALGANTREAIEAFQKDNGLKVSRFVDNATWEKMSQFENCGLLKEGELNMLSVQEALKKAGFDPGPIDGKVGQKTEKAILAFQEAHGLKPDGKIGLKTLNQLSLFLDPS